MRKKIVITEDELRNNPDIEEQEKAEGFDLQWVVVPTEEFSEEEANELLAAMDEPRETLITIAEDDMNAMSSFQSFIDRFVTFHKGKGSSEQTIRYYLTNYQRLMDFFSWKVPNTKGKPVTDYPITLMAHNSFEALYRDYLTTEKGLKEQTVVSSMRAYRAFYYFCSRENDWLPRKTIKLAQPELPLKPLFTEEQLDKILRKPDKIKDNFIEYRNWVIVNYVYNTGNRCGSIVGIKMKDLGEIDEGFILVQVQKNRKPQRLAVPMKVVSLLKQYIRAYRSAATPEEYLFCNEYGEGTTANAMTQSIQKYMDKRLGEDKPEGAGLHRLRHQFAAEYMKDEGSMFDLQKQLGHRSLYMTKHYADKYGKPNHDNLEAHAPINKRRMKVGRKKIK